MRKISDRHNGDIETGQRLIHGRDWGRRYCWRCGGSLVALLTTEAVVPGSNLVSLTVKNSEDRQSHFVYCKNIGAERETSPGGQKKR